LDSVFLDRKHYAEDFAKNMIAKRALGSMEVNCRFFCFALLGAIMPPFWMCTYQPYHFHFSSAARPVQVMMVLSFVALFNFLYILALVTQSRVETIKKVIVQQSVLAYFCSTDLGRKFVYRVFKDNYFRDVKLRMEGSLEPFRPDEGTTNVMDLKTMELTQLHDELAEEMRSAESWKLDVDRSDMILQINLYRALRLWTRIDWTLGRLQLQTWLHCLVGGVGFTACTALLNLFVWRRVTVVTLLLGWTLLPFFGLGSVLGYCVNHGVFYNRLQQDISLGLLENWREIIKNTHRMNIQNIVLVENRGEELSDKRVMVDNFYRFLIDPFEQAIQEVGATEVPLTVFGVAMTMPTINRIIFALLTCLCTGMWNFARSSSEVNDVVQSVIANSTVKIPG